MVDSGGAADQHLLGVASAECAGAAERFRVDHSNAPAGLAAAHRRNPRRRSGTEHEEIEWLRHQAPTSDAAQHSLAAPLSRAA